MKVKIILVLSVTVLSLAATVFSYVYVNHTVNALDGLHEKAAESVASGNFEAAEKTLTDMLALIEKRTSILESLVPHSSVHDLKINLTDSLTSLRIRDLDDYKKAMALFTESINHLKAHEKPSLSNFL